MGSASPMVKAHKAPKEICSHVSGPGVTKNNTQSMTSCCLLLHTLRVRSCWRLTKCTSLDMRVFVIHTLTPPVVTRTMCVCVCVLFVVCCLIPTGDRCDPVPIVSHATPDHVDANNGSVVVYTCNVGFTFSPGVTNTSMTCDGISWTSTHIACLGKKNIYVHFKRKLQHHHDSLWLNVGGLYVFYRFLLRFLT